eukprot:SAG31_NODE_1937_length_6866_cov_3.173932_5_plen_112_part_00
MVLKTALSACHTAALERAMDRQLQTAGTSNDKAIVVDDDDEDEDDYAAADADEAADVDDELFNRDIWVQCDHKDCLKWRKLPPGITVDEDTEWFCQMNPVRKKCLLSLSGL